MTDVKKKYNQIKIFNKKTIAKIPYKHNNCLDTSQIHFHRRELLTMEEKHACTNPSPPHKKDVVDVCSQMCTIYSDWSAFQRKFLTDSMSGPTPPICNQLLCWSTMAEVKHTHQTPHAAWLVSFISHRASLWFFCHDEWLVLWLCYALLIQVFLKAVLWYLIYLRKWMSQKNETSVEEY